ncbi:hypothetical protein Ahy_A02g006658 [Arachis hypogaea]|uniref:Protein FAR1-RELATED SEQUENCE n=1 Tax=Arachis hypogaea TaxID=3818 RepID=A0A445EAJ1_ARAHY|nr:hypothetical protein Ahy_A02g006658 [Arachis hypogaea]
MYIVNEQFVPKIGMTFKTLEETEKFYKDYSKLVGFSTKIKNTTRKGDEIKNKLITCSRERTGINCRARIYVHILKDVGLWIISKVLNHSHLCCLDRAGMLKQHRELSMFVHRTIENNKEAGIRPSKTYISVICTSSGQSSRTKNFGMIFSRSMVSEAINDFQVIAVLFELIDVFFLFTGAIQRPSFVDFSLSRSPLLAWDEKHQRSESMHTFFNKFITRNSSLIQFVKQYDNCLGSIEQRERKRERI